jgi:hypothetical protein
MTTKHITNCPCCFKIFKKKGCYEKHILYCERNDRPNKEPNIGQLYEMIQTLTDKYNNVQTELESIKRQINIKNKKLNVLSWLNENCISEKNIDFIDLANNIQIEESDLNIIFEKGYIDGIFEIIRNSFILKKEKSQLNFIKCFQQKKNILYIFHDGLWKELSIDNFSKIMNDLNIKIFAAFNCYRETNKDKLEQDEFQIVFANNLNKLICNNISVDQRCIRIKNKLYGEFNECFKTIVEYEIE